MGSGMKISSAGCSIYQGRGQNTINRGLKYLKQVVQYTMGREINIL